MTWFLTVRYPENMTEFVYNKHTPQIMVKLNEWKNCGGGNSFFNCGTSDSRGVEILLSKKFKENVEFFSQDNSGRILRSTLKINDSTFYISNIYAPNNGKERKSFFNAINDTLFKYTDDSDKNYSLILGDFNCAIQKNLDRNPPQQLDDISVREFQSMLHRNDLFDVWRKLNPETKRYTVLLNAVNRNQESIIFYVVTP